jgi:predicted aconitase
MYLTPEQEKLLVDGRPSEQTAMKLLVTLGEVHDAGRLIPVTWAHISGASYLTIGDTGLEFLEDFCHDVSVRVKSTVNPVSIDLEKWREMGVPKEYAEKQMRIVEAYRRIGVEETYSCTPYLIGQPPSKGDHLAWAESSAAIYANAVLGARTNREGGPSALSSAVTGLTPEFGLHLDENRKASVKVSVEAKLDGMRYSLLGLALGQMLGGDIPYFQKLPGSDEDLKWFGAALASTSDVTLFHVEKRTPEYRNALQGRLMTIRVTDRDLREVQKSFTTGKDADVIGIGSPQLSAKELEAIAVLMKRYRPKLPVWIFSSRDAKSRAKEAVKIIESLGGKVWADTCLEVSPLYYSFKTVATPSGKGAYYLPSLCKQKVILEDLAKLLRRYS